MLQMPRARTHLVEMPETSTEVRTMWERPHHGASSTTELQRNDNNGTKRKSATDDPADNQHGIIDRRRRECGKQSMTIDI